MNENLKQFKEPVLVLIGYITSKNVLETFRLYAPDVIQATQILIGILTVIYLIVKIVTHKKHERSN